MMFDTHCHLSFSEDGERIARYAEGSLAAFVATVDPRSCEEASRRFSSFPNIRVGLGLHPWNVLDDDVLVEEFEAAAPFSPFIGEVGLDFSPYHEATRERQIAVFDRVVAACMREGKTASVNSGSISGMHAGGLISIHAVRAVDEVIDAFERAGALRGASRAAAACANGRALVLHSFAGTSDQLQRALDCGFYLSASPRTIRTKRGRAYACAIPQNRFLLETDLPSKKGERFSYDVWHRVLDETWEAVLEARFGEGLTEAALKRRESFVRAVNESSERMLFPSLAGLC